LRNRWGILAVLFAVRAVFYACMMLGPVVGSACAKWAGSAAAAFDFGAAMILACPVLLWGFNRIPADLPKLA
jgi:hypothetical protein